MLKGILWNWPLLLEVSISLMDKDLEQFLVLLNSKHFRIFTFLSFFSITFKFYDQKNYSYTLSKICKN